MIEEAHKDLVIYFDYEVDGGINAEFADTIMKRFVDTLPDKSYPQFYANDVYRFLYASHLAEKDEAMKPWLIPEQDMI